MTERIKKMMGTKLNSKGFSLVELLIVIAIMGVLAVIAFNAFGGVLTGSKKSADRQQAKNIERAVRTLITDSGISKFNSTSKSFYKKDTMTAADKITINDGEALINMMMEVAFVKDQLTGESKICGPYLAPEKTGNTYYQFAPQWNPDAGGKNVGWKIDVDTTINSATVSELTTDDIANGQVTETAYPVQLWINSTQVGS